MSLKTNKFFIAAIASFLVITSFLGGFLLGQAYSYKRLGISINKKTEIFKKHQNPIKVHGQVPLKYP